jgi:uncharacterized membrane protein
MKFVLAYLATAVAMLALDAVWLGLIAMPMYQQAIGHLMAEKMNASAAGLFYAVYVTGLMVYAVVPRRESAEWGGVLRSAALFGFFTYATYDLTNLATLNNWPVEIVVIDLVWGMFISASAASAGWIVIRRFA